MKSLLQDNLGAIEDYNKAEKIAPADPEVFYNRGNAENDLKLYEKAILDYNKAIALKEHEDYYLGRGVSKKANGQYASAILDFTQAIRINPKFDDAYYNRGNAKWKIDSVQSSILDYNIAIELNHGKAGAFINRGNAKITLKRIWRGDFRL